MATGSAANVTRIMLAVDVSTMVGYPIACISSLGAFKWAIQKIVRSNVSDFELLLLHVPSDQAFCKRVIVLGFSRLCDNAVRVCGGDIGKIYTSPECFETMESRDHARGLHLLEYFVKRCKEIGVACQAWIVTGDPKTAICLEARRIQPDLLVMGSRALSLVYLSIGTSVSDFCLKHAECPVVRIKRRPDEAPLNPLYD
ncbi:universal stress protein A-like protein [Hibiscus syriacus]|uniref:universal stress protein A-like protein n=1 Tax=Hibiscus syriacus TaxID=106335 RepID=UPI00192413BC|nr:universal stress protein A-like protein [Hibiscus syriacus]